MRILIFSTAYFPLIGGAEVALKELTDRMPDVEFHLVCAKIKPQLVNEEKIGNVTVHRVGSGSARDKALLSIFGVIKALSLPRPDAVWSLMASYGGFAALVYTWLRPEAKMLLSLQEGDPLEHYAKRAGRLNFLHKQIFKRADAVQAISHFLSDWSVRMGFKGTPQVIPNGVDLKNFSKRLPPERRTTFRKSFGFNAGDTVLVTASRLSLKNGVDDLIRALALLPPDYKLLIAGDGEDREKLRVLAEQKSVVSRIVFLGSVSHRDLPTIFQSSDIFIRPSLSEGLGNAFLEAMAAGVPIIGTPVGGIPDFLIQAKTGIFCKPRNPESIVEAIHRIQDEPGLREQLVANAERAVRDGYDWSTITARIRKMLKALSAK